MLKSPNWFEHIHAFSIVALNCFIKAEASFINANNFIIKAEACFMLRLPSAIKVKTSCFVARGFLFIAINFFNYTF